MKSDTIKLSTNGFHRYRAEPVSYMQTFAHVLNLQATEVVWPEDAAELFFPEYFAVQFVSGGDVVYRHRNSVHKHMREELLRQCVSHDVSIENLWKWCCVADNSERNPVVADAAYEYCKSDALLLNEEQLSPRRLAPDSSEFIQIAADMSVPRQYCQVGTNQPIEQEE